ncbi:FliH/SctL family protein [Burkholderia sp. PU8-34]
MAIIKAGRVLLTSDREVLPVRRGTARNQVLPDPSAGPDPTASGVTARDATTAPERNALNARVAELEALLADSRAALDTRADEAFERGAETARRQFVRSETERAEIFQVCVADARRALTQKLDAMETLAIDLSLAALERVLGNPDDYASLVVATIRHRMALLAEGSVLAIRVSAADFPDASALEKIETGSHVELVADPALQEGACLIDLQLGRIDASISRQHERIARLLNEGHHHD